MKKQAPLLGSDRVVIFQMIQAILSLRLRQPELQRAQSQRKMELTKAASSPPTTGPITGTQA